MDTAKKYILLVGILLCGLICTISTKDQTLAIRYLAWSALTLTLVMFRPSIPRNPVTILLAAYLVCSAIAVSNAVNVQAAVMGLLPIILMIAFYSCATSIKPQRLFVLMGFLFSLLGFYQLFVEKRILTGTMSYASAWTITLVILLPFCTKTIFARVVGSMLFINILLLPTRSAKLALVTACIASCVFKRKMKRFAIILCIGFFAACYFVPHLSKRPFLDTSSMQQRIYVWQETINMALDNPLGVGIGNWKICIARYSEALLSHEGVYSRLFDKQFFQRPHNDFLWVLSESGFAGLLCYAGIFVYGTYKAYKLRNIPTFFALVSIAVYACFSFPMERAFLCIIFVVLLATIYEPVRRFKIDLIPVMVVITIAFAVNFHSDVRLHNIYKARADSQWATVIDEADRCFIDADWFGIPLKFYRGEANMYLGNILDTHADYTEAYKVNPYYTYLLNNMGTYYALVNMNDESERYYNEALAVVPLEDIQYNLNLVMKRGK